jgi:D-inositol-3-phosphate glycosyltransferase
MEGLRIAVISVHTSPLAQPGGNKAGGLNVYMVELAKQRAVHLPAGPKRHLPPEDIIAHLPEFEQAMIGFCERENAAYDLIHSHYWLSGLVGEALKEVWEVPHVTMFHTLGEIKNRASLSEHETDLRIETEAKIISGVARVICATEQERALIEQLYAADGGKISVIPLGVDLDRFKPIEKDDARRELNLKDERIILFVGRLEPLKGVDILINAAAMLESDVECSVLIVGGDESSNAEVAELQALARERFRT